MHTTADAKGVRVIKKHNIHPVEVRDIRALVSGAPIEVKRTVPTYYMHSYYSMYSKWYCSNVYWMCYWIVSVLYDYQDDLVCLSHSIWWT